MAHKSYGVKLQYADGLNEIVGPLTSIDGVPTTADILDVTNHDSTESFRKYLQGLRDGGTFSVAGQFDARSIGQRALRSHFFRSVNGGARAMVIVYPVNTEVAFNAMLTALTIPGDMSIDGVMQFSATFQITGSLVMGAANRRLSLESIPAVESVPGTGGMGLGWFNPRVTVHFVEPPDSISGIASTADSGQGPPEILVDGTNTWSYGFPISGQSKYMVKLTATKAGYEDFECILSGAINAIQFSGAMNNVDTEAVMMILTYLPDGPLGMLSPTAESYAFNIHKSAGPITIRFDFRGFPDDDDPSLLGYLEHTFNGAADEQFDLDYNNLVSP